MDKIIGTHTVYRIHEFIPGDKMFPPRAPEDGSWLEYAGQQQPYRTVHDAAWAAHCFEQRTGHKTRIIKATTTLEVVDLESTKETS